MTHEAHRPQHSEGALSFISGRREYTVHYISWKHVVKNARGIQILEATIVRIEQGHQEPRVFSSLGDKSDNDYSQNLRCPDRLELSILCETMWARVTNHVHIHTDHPAFLHDAQHSC